MTTSHRDSHGALPLSPANLPPAHAERGRSPASAGKGFLIRHALVGLVGIPIVALVVSLGYDTYRQYRDDLAAAYRTAAQIRAISQTQTEQFIAQARFALSELSLRPDVRALDASRCDPLLAAIKQLQPAYANVLTLDVHGRMVCNAAGIAPKSATGPDPRFYFAEVMRTGRFTVGKPTRGFLTGRWVSTLAHPIRGDDGRIIGVVGIAVDLVNFTPARPHKDAPARTVVGIINGDGVIVARSEDAEQRVGRPANPANVALLLQQREGTLSARDFRGADRLFSFAPVADTDWIVFSATDEADVIAPVIRLAWIRLAFVLGLIGAVSVITYRLLRRIARPVEDISRTMASVGGGALDERAALAGPAELRQIASGLNAMLDARAGAERDLRQSEDRFRTAFRISPDALVITRLDDGRFLEVNDAFTPMTGWRREEVVGRTSTDFGLWHHVEDRQRILQSVQQSGHCANVESEFLTRDGRVLTGLISSQVMTLGDVPCLLSIIRDISDRKAADETIQTLSFSDPLTRLPNRRLFMDRLGQALISSGRHDRHGALAFVDLDDFRTINETLGHEHGDAMLREVAARMGHCVRQGDTVARLGGDEFVVLLEDLSANAREAASQVEAVSEEILTTLAQPFAFAGAAHHCTACIGIALFGQRSEDPTEPLKRAELAMYQAKSSGRGQLRFFDPRMQAAVSARAAMEAGLRGALDKGQFLLHYQAQVSDDGRVTGAEALVRWNDPRRGMVSPAEFIPLAEESGLILPLGRWVLRTACVQLARWASQPAMAHLTVAVNVSARQFHQDDFVDQVLAVLAETGADPRRLKLEMTESMLVSNVEDVIGKMNALKGRGVGFSLDDFGTGYSSLTYLKRLPLDQLKIDQGFVRDILIDPNDAAIASMVVALAASVGLAVIAEGVETEAQRDRLAALGCRHYQGYLFSRPVPVREFEALVAPVSTAPRA